MHTCLAHMHTYMGICARMRAHTHRHTHSAVNSFVVGPEFKYDILCSCQSVHWALGHLGTPFCQRLCDVPSFVGTLAQESLPMFFCSQNCL